MQAIKSWNGAKKWHTLGQIHFIKSVFFDIFLATFDKKKQFVTTWYHSWFDTSSGMVEDVHTNRQMRSRTPQLHYSLLTEIEFVRFQECFWIGLKYTRDFQEKFCHNVCCLRSFICHPCKCQWMKRRCISCSFCFLSRCGAPDTNFVDFVGAADFVLIFLDFRIDSLNVGMGRE